MAFTAIRTVYFLMAYQYIIIIAILNLIIRCLKCPVKAAVILKHIRTVIGVDFLGSL